MDIDFAERHIAHELNAHHDHACDPEEDNVKACNKYIARIKIVKRFGFLRPPQGAKRPQRRREPGIEYIFVLAQFDVSCKLVLFPNIILRIADVYVAIIVVPGWNTMPPPELPTDTPVLDVVHPVEVSLRPVFRDETNRTTFDSLNGWLGERLNFHVPLISQVRFDDSM